MTVPVQAGAACAGPAGPRAAAQSARVPSAAVNGAASLRPACLPCIEIPLFPFGVLADRVPPDCHRAVKLRSQLVIGGTRENATALPGAGAGSAVTAGAR